MRENGVWEALQEVRELQECADATFTLVPKGTNHARRLELLREHPELKAALRTTPTAWVIPESH